MESEQEEMEDGRSKGDERAEDGGHGGREEGMIRTGQDRTGQDNIVTAGLNEFDMGEKMG